MKKTQVEKWAVGELNKKNSKIFVSPYGLGWTCLTDGYQMYILKDDECNIKQNKVNDNFYKTFNPNDKELYEIKEHSRKDVGKIMQVKFTNDQENIKVYADSKFFKYFENPVFKVEKEPNRPIYVFENSGSIKGMHVGIIMPMRMSDAISW